MWITTVFATVFLGFVSTSVVGALSIAALRVPAWQPRARVGLLVCGALAAGLWGLTAARVERAYDYAWQTVGALAFAVILSGYVGGLFFPPAITPPTRASVVLRVTAIIGLAIICGALLAILPACQLDVGCDP